ncbi:MAG: hypothetical protein LAP38_18210 [Acidobacteriia bacterium]|nr:hypothetical protein [Terriglobia bacterium]
MMRTVAVLLSVTLAAGVCSGQPPVPARSIGERLRAIAPDTPVEVRLLDHSQLRGWIGDVSDSDFVLSHEVKRQLQRSRIRIDQVREVKVVKNVKPSHTTRNILIGVGIAVAVIGGLLAAAAASGPVVY